MSECISHKAEGDQFVIRIPASYPGAVLVALEGPAGIWPTGFLVVQGAKAEIPLEGLNRLSGLRGSHAAPCSSDRAQLPQTAPRP